MIRVPHFVSRASLTLAAVAALTFCGALQQPAAAGATLNINLGVATPQWAPVPGTRVYVVEDNNYDFYRYGTYYYVRDGGTWYRSRTTRGPFHSYSSRYVPREVRRGYDVRLRGHGHDEQHGNMGHGNNGHGNNGHPGGKDKHRAS